MGSNWIIRKSQSGGANIFFGQSIDFSWLKLNNSVIFCVQKNHISLLHYLKCSAGQFNLFELWKQWAGWRISKTMAGFCWLLSTADDHTSAWRKPTNVVAPLGKIQTELLSTGCSTLHLPRENMKMSTYCHIFNTTLCQFKTKLVISALDNSFLCITSANIHNMFNV